LTSENFK